VEIGIKPVHGAEPGVVDVAVDVVGEQRRQRREDGDEDDDRAPDEAAVEPRRQRQDAEVSEEAGPDQAEGERRVDGGATSRLRPLRRRLRGRCWARAEPVGPAPGA
jgi:hypothetical protein